MDLVQLYLNNQVNRGKISIVSLNVGRQVNHAQRVDFPLETYWLVYIMDHEVGLWKMALSMDKWYGPTSMVRLLKK